MSLLLLCVDSIIQREEWREELLHPLIWTFLKLSFVWCWRYESSLRDRVLEKNFTHERGGKSLSSDL